MSVGGELRIEFGASSVSSVLLILTFVMLEFLSVTRAGLIFYGTSVVAVYGANEDGLVNLVIGLSLDF